MADFSIAAQAGQGGAQGGGQNAFAQFANPMNMMQLMQMRQAMGLQQEQARRAAEAHALSQESGRLGIDTTRSAEARAAALHIPQLQSAQAAADKSAMDLQSQKEKKSLSDLYFKTLGERSDNLFDPDFLKETRSKNPKFYEILKKEKDAEDTLKAARQTAERDGRTQTVETLTKELDYTKKVASVLAPALDNPNLDPQTFFKAYDVIAKGNSALPVAVPREFTPENVGRLKQALDGMATITHMSLAGGNVVVFKNGVPVGTVDPDAPGGVRPFSPANPPPPEVAKMAPAPQPAAAAPQTGVTPAAGGATGAAAPTGQTVNRMMPAGGDGNSMAANMLRRYEGFREQPYMDAGSLRTGYGSDTVTRADGTVERVQQGTRVSREDAERDLSRRINTEFAPRAARAVGPQVWSSLPPNVQAALTSVTYNYGSLPQRVVAAVQTGDVRAIAQAVQALGSDNGGVNARRRAEEAAVILGAPMTPVSMGGGAAPQQTGQTPMTGAMPPNALAAMMGQQAAPQIGNAAAPRPPLAAPPAMNIGPQTTTAPRALTFGERVKLGEEQRAALREQEKEDRAAKREQEKEARLSKQRTDEYRSRKEIDAETKREEKASEELKNVQQILPELKSIAAEGGLISQSTGSGLGRAFDTGAGFFGSSTAGARAIARLAPIADMVLKNVPRFEGPQSDKDTQSYKEAAGQLADATAPRETRRAAAQEIIRLLEKREAQIASKSGGAQAAVPDGATATNAQTGQRLIMRNGQWEPLQ